MVLVVWLLRWRGQACVLSRRISCVVACCSSLCFIMSLYHIYFSLSHELLCRHQTGYHTNINPNCQTLFIEPPICLYLAKQRQCHPVVISEPTSEQHKRRGELTLCGRHATTKAQLLVMSGSMCGVVLTH